MTNTNMSTESSVVYRRTLKILGIFFCGMPLSANLTILERYYRIKFKRSPHYQSLGVTNVKELADKMGNMVVVFEKNKIKHVMSARAVEASLNELKIHVLKLFNRHGGEIKFDSFELFYKEYFYCKLSYYFYGLSNLDHLCEVLKDILEVGVDCSGEKVIKQVIGYNLRKRKNSGEKVIKPVKCYNLRKRKNRM